MSLDKAIKHGKEHRKPYRGAKRHFIECRNHGGCDYCLNARFHSEKRRIEEMQCKIDEYWTAETNEEWNDTEDQKYDR